MGISSRQFRFKGDLFVVIPGSMGNEPVDPFDKLIDGDTTKAVHREVSHQTVSFGHDQRVIPVVCGRGDDFVELFCRAGDCWAGGSDFIDSGHLQIAETFHQIARRSDRIDDLLVILVAGGNGLVLPAPTGDGLRVGLSVEIAAQGKECVSGCLGFGTDVVPEGRIEQNGVAPISFFIYFIKSGSPDTSLRPVDGYLVVEGVGDDGAESIGHPFVVGFMDHINESLSCSRIEIIHIGITIGNANELHHFPGALRCGPAKGISGNFCAQIDSFFGVDIHSDDTHQFSLFGERFAVCFAIGYLSFDLVQPFNGQIWITLHEAGRVVTVDSTCATTGEAVFVVKRYLQSLFRCFAYGIHVEVKIFIREVFWSEFGSEGEDSDTAVSAIVVQTDDLLIDTFTGDGGVIPEPKGMGSIRCRRIFEVFRRWGCGLGGQGK